MTQLSVCTALPPRPNESFAVGLLRRMLEIPSLSYEERPLAELLVRSMRELGFDARVDEAGNAVGEIVRGGTRAVDGPTVMLLGHMDTVSGEVPVQARDGLLYGRGAVDAKGPLAAMICAAAAADRFRGRIVVVGAVEEETVLSRGAAHIGRTHRQPDALVIGEPSGWDTAVLGYKGKLDLVYEVEVPATHGSNPDPKASELAAACWAQLLDLLGPDAGHGSFDRPGPTLESITGDLTSARVEMSVRVPPGFDHDGLVSRLSERLPQGRLDLVNAVRAVRVGRTDPVVRALSAAIRRQGVRPGAKVKTATSDMNTLAEGWRIPMATYGPGDSKLDHSDQEHIVLSDYLSAIKVLTDALHELSDTLRPAASDPTEAHHRGQR
ncbi:M20/M25/M40 family metallo-hydrolase [Streptomyces achromogenes]|uniref:M20/M25/M40 family metallo-hydrolase n=2 Tax=Streptomyces achromogenes TaxID=67255 RepID=A0ABZ1KG09_STRAH|nr:M20/M25/M40 family metallo-hydrolase [Streptomyces achromogenes]MCZ0209718.1 M20/M25/M40 family metallo-hydrolase [Streptomyces sp. UMAF16]